MFASLLLWHAQLIWARMPCLWTGGSAKLFLSFCFFAGSKPQNQGVIQLRMKTRVLPLFSKCSLYQKPTQTNTNKKNKTWTLTPHDLYLPMPSQAWLPASLRPGRVCKEKIRKATNPNGRWWHRDSHTTCHSHWIVTKSWHLYPSSGSTTLAP